MFKFDEDRESHGSVIDLEHFSNATKNDLAFTDRAAVLTGSPLQFPDRYPRTLTEALIRAASSDKMIVFVDARGGERELTYYDLLRRAQHVLAALQGLGAGPGKAVILQLDELEEFLVTFWACVLGGLVPVPVLPFRSADAGDSSFRKLQRIASQLERPIVLMSGRNAESIRKSAGGGDQNGGALLPDCRIATFDDIGNCTDNAAIDEVRPDDLAFLQFTSGSTSFPKGVRVTHANVLTTNHGMSSTIGLTESSCLVNWMPLYHDMGLIAGHLMAVIGMCKVVAMKPFTFVRRPLLWLEKIHQHRANITFSPNFGFRRVLEKAQANQIKGFDLSCLEVIINGAEPISVQTCNRFVELLNTHCGLRRECIAAGYGLAEAGLTVSLSPPGKLIRKHVLNRNALGCGARVEYVTPDDPRATWFADVGPVVTGMNLKIVDDNDQVVPVGTVGHVQIRGRSVTSGYFANEQANLETFCDGWFRTGDLGFIYDDRFVITGRVKDVVFVNGQNYYSHDFEHACEDIEGLDRLVIIGHSDPVENEETVIAFVACSKEFIGAREKTAILRNVQKRINQRFDVTPNIFVLLKSAGEIPKTTSGKIMRHKLLEQYMEGRFANQRIRLAELLEIAPDLDRESDAGKHVTIAELKLLIRSWWSDVLGISKKAIGDHDPFFTLGGTSIKAVEVLALAEDSLDCAITHEMFKEHDTIHRLANHIARENLVVRCRLDDLVKIGPANDDEAADVAPEAVTEPSGGEVAPYCVETEVDESDIAIIGMGCIFPQANDIGEFWKLLEAGRDCITEVPTDRCNINHYFDKDSGAPNLTISKWGSFIDSHHFDPKFFNLTESEAITMDPHQRVFLNAAWQAIQDAGLVNFEGSRMGVFVGASGTGFYQEREDAPMTPTTLTGALANLAAARVSHAFNLKGPSLSVDTACSSSLVSVDLACKSILSGESDIALAGGVQVMESIVIYLLFSRAGILSPDGKCYTFSDKANGFVPGEGAGAVVLKRYRDAIRDGDRVYAVIKASAINNDGASLGIMAPNPEGQENVIKAALSRANIDPADIGYVEAHGTGTHIGDLIEVRSLSLAYNEKKPVANQSCAIGSVKTNLGHQLAAAGISGLIKATLAVYHQRVPATLNCEQVRKELKIAETPFFVCQQTMPWPKPGPRRLAAVNSFGFGGTNAHVILSDPYHEEIHHQLPALPDEPYVLCLSAKTEESLTATRNAFAQHARAHSGDTTLRDMTYTAAARRAHYRQNRIAMVVRSVEDAATLAQGGRVNGAAVFERRSMSKMRRRIAWLFSGQGSQHPAMGRALFHSEPVFRDIVNRCDEIARPLMGVSLRDLLVSSTHQHEVSSTAITQPLVFTMDYALAKLWKSWGVKPDFMLGHSIGEYVAACLSGVFALEDALQIIVRRGELMGGLPAGGGMTAVLLAPEDLARHVQAAGLPLDIAAYNGPSSTVVSGKLDALRELHARLDREAVSYAPLQVSHAFHSRCMEPMLAEFRRLISAFRMLAPATPMICNVSGKLYQGNEFSPDYWVDHIRQPVQFHRGVQNLVAAGAEIFLEVGAQAHLTGLTRRIINGGNALALSSLPKFTPEASASQQIALAQAELYVNGVDLDWRSYYESHGERRWQSRRAPGGIERRSGRKSSVAGGRMVSAPGCVLEKRSMFRVVGTRKYPFRHLFRRVGPDEYEFVPDPESVLFRDHVVARTPMMSGAAQCDLISHLHAQSFAHPPKCLRNLSFHQPWLAKAKLTVAFSGNVEKDFAVTDARGHAVFKGHSSTFTSIEVPESILVQEIERRLPHSYTQDTVYEVFGRCGMEYGPFHRKIIAMRASGTEALARLRPPAKNPAHWSNGYYLHPGILDSAFQATAGLLMAKMEGAHEPGDFPTMVPVGIESINIFKFVQGGEYVSHVTLDGDPAANIGGDTISCNIGLYDMDGAPCAMIRRLTLKRMPAAARSQPKRTQPHAVGDADRQSESAEFFHAVWAERPATGSDEPARWLVFGSANAVEQQIAPSLADNGVDTLLVPFTHYQGADESALHAIFEKCGSVDGILFLGDLDATPAGADAADTQTMSVLFRLFRALNTWSRKHKDWQRVRFVRATRNAYRLDDTDRAFDIRKSVSTGFLRTARIEFPLMDVRQVDLGNTADAHVAACLRNELGTTATAVDEGPEVLHAHGRRFVLTVEPVTLAHCHRRDAVFNSDKVFWILGATSGVGQLLARYLATQFRANLVLSGSRRLPDPSQYDVYVAGHTDGIAETIRFIREIESLGSKVTYLSTDVRSADSIRASLDAIGQMHPRLNGVYFSALQLDDRMIVQKDWPGYRNMIDMRVNGVDELVRQVAPYKPGFFALFSSLAGLTGNIGQSDYAASCAYMDSIPFAQPPDASCRFITIQWGPWSLGQQVSEVVLEHMRRNGFLHISSLLGMEALEKLILSDRKHVAFVPGSMDARHIASNINSLRKGLSAKPARSHAATPTQVEVSVMSGTTARIDRVVSGGHVQVLITEFEKQRGMLLKLFESQNALLASVLGGAPVEVAPEAVEHRPAPVLVTEPPPQPFIHQREHAPTVSAAVESAPIPQAPPPIAPAVAVTKPAPAPAPAPAQPPAGAANLFEYVRSLMAKAVQMQESDIDPDQNFMELGADSMTAMTMVKEMEQRYNIELPATLLFEYTTLNELVDYLKTEIGDNSGGAQRA